VAGSVLEDELGFQLKAVGLEPEREYRFCERRWRLDFAFPAVKVGVEIQGGIYSHGRHVRGAGYEHDMEKANCAVLLGWKVLQFSPAMVRDGRAVAVICECLKVV